VVARFEEGKFYVMTGGGEKWSDYDGPFESGRAAVQHMADLCGEFASPEMLKSSVVTKFKDGVLSLVRDDRGNAINGSTIYWKNTVVLDNEIIWESPASKGVL
jgi:hypothetical protein